MSIQQAMKAKQYRDAALKAVNRKQWGSAAKEFARAVDQQPHDTRLWLELTHAQLQMNEPAAAQASAERLFALQPRSLPACKLLAGCLKQRGHLSELVALCEGLHESVPRDEELLLLQADALMGLQRGAEAVTLLTRTLELNIRNAVAHYRLGLVLTELKMIGQATVCFETAILTDADGSKGVRAMALSHLVSQLAAAGDWERLQPRQAELLKLLDEGSDESILELTPFSLLAIPSSPAQQLRLSRLRSAALTRRTVPVAGRGPRSPGRLRIGYLSADFCAHATIALLAELIELRDRDRFEVFLYCHSPEDHSVQQQRIRAAADHFRPIGRMSDAEAAQLMADDGIDIAIDLKGHTRDSRMQLLAGRPAPVQVGYLGYPGSSGATFLDYIIGDPAVTPVSMAANFSERIAQLPNSYQPNDRHRELPLAPPRETLGLPDDALVLTCFNQTYKFSPELADCWAAILRAVPDAVLWLLAWNRDAQKNLVRELGARGVAEARIVFSPLAGMVANLARLQCADLFLDTWPCNAHTTASEALWAGVPVLTVPGETFASRVAASLVQACELPAFVCDSADTYVARAIALLRDPAELRAAQAHLREHRSTLPLFDTERYARDFESLLLRMWARHEAGLAPEHLPAETVAAQAEPAAVSRNIAVPPTPIQTPSLTMPITATPLDLQIAAALMPAAPATTPTLAMDARIAELEAANQQMVASFEALVDNLVQLRNEDLQALDQRTREQAEKIGELQSALDLERTNRDLAEVSRMHPKARIVVFVGGTYFGNNVKYAWLAAQAQAEALRAECWFLPMDAAQAELIAQTGGHCFPVAGADWSAEHLHTALSAAVAVIDDHLLNSNPYAAALLAGARQVQLWHGVSIKEIGLRNLHGLGAMSPRFARVLRTCGPFSRLVGTSAGQEAEFRRWFAFDQYAPIGYPRNDVLLREPSAQDLLNVDLDVYHRAQDYRQRGKRVFLYAPTFRDGNHAWMVQAGLPELAVAIAAAGDLLIVNLHPVEQPLVPKLAEVMPQVSFVKARTDVYPLLARTTALITDYSSIMFDYLLLDQPVLLFRPDHEAYTTRSRKLFDAKLENPPGPVATTVAELVKLVKPTGKERPGSGQARQQLLETLHDRRDGEAGQRLMGLVAQELDAALGVK